MKTCLSHRTIITAMLMTSTFGVVAQAGSYRVISQDFSDVTEICDQDCKSNVSNKTRSTQDWLKAAIALVKKDDFSAANYALNKSIKVAKIDRDFSTVPRALIELGGISFSQKNYSLAQSYFTGAVEAAEENADCVNGATAYLNLGLVERRMGDKTAARKMFRNSLRLTRGTKAHSLRVNAMFQYGRIQKELNNKAWAKKALLKAQVLSRKYALNNLYKASSNALNAMGMAQASRPVARTLAKARIRTATPKLIAPKLIAKVTPKKLPNKSKAITQTSFAMADQDMAVTYDKLGASHIDRRQYDMASTMFRQSIFLNKQMGNVAAEAKGYKKLAQIYVKLGDHKNSCVNFWQARTLMSEANKAQEVEGLTKQLKSNNCLLQQAALDIQ